MFKRNLAAVISAVVTVASAVVLVTALGAPEQPVKAAADRAVYQVSNAEYQAPVTAVEEGTRVIEIVPNSQEADELDTEMIRAIVEKNRVFGDYINSDDALIEAAQIALLDLVYEANGNCYIDRQAVDSYIYEIYGKTMGDNAYVVDGIEALDGTYVVLPRGFDCITYGHTQVSRFADGKVAAVSEVLVEGLDSVELITVRTVLAAVDNGNGYIIVSADICE